MTEHQDRNYDRIWGLSASAALGIALKLFVPDSDFNTIAVHEFKTASKIYEAMNKGVDPANEIVDIAYESANTSLSGEIHSAYETIKLCAKSPKMDVEQREFMLSEALQGFSLAYGELQHVSALRQRKAEVAGYIAVTYLACGSFSSAKAWFEQSRKDYQEVLLVSEEEFGFFEETAESLKPVTLKEGGGLAVTYIMTALVFFVSPPLAVTVLATGVSSTLAVTGASAATEESRDRKKNANLALQKSKEESRLAIVALDNILLSCF
jgi:hypothetical protein